MIFPYDVTLLQQYTYKYSRSDLYLYCILPLLILYLQYLLVLYLVPKLDALISIVWEGLAGNKSTSALLSLQLAILINHPTLTHDQRRTSTALQSLKDVVF